MINKFNISKPEKYTDKYGTEKTQWHNIGTMTEFSKENGDVSRILEIPAIGLKANIFPFKDKAQITQVSQPIKSTPPGYLNKKEEADTIEYPADDINPDDIPF